MNINVKNQNEKQNNFLQLHSSFLVSLIIEINHYKPKKNSYCSQTFKSYPKRSEQFLGTVDWYKKSVTARISGLLWGQFSPLRNILYKGAHLATATSAMEIVVLFPLGIHVSSGTKSAHAQKFLASAIWHCKSLVLMGVPKTMYVGIRISILTWSSCIQNIWAGGSGAWITHVKLRAECWSMNTSLPPRISV